MIFRSFAAAALAVAVAGGAVPAAEAGESAGKFVAWLDGVRAEARAQGISEPTLAAAFEDLQPDPRVVKLDRRQPEFTLTFAEYMDRVVTVERVTNGRRALETHRALLNQVAAEYGVPPHVIVALWGVETKYGTRTGDFDIIRSLATLAFDGRRSAFFRKELMNALHILDQGHVRRDRMRGSWAGAMGQSQFMPSSFRAFAIDHGGDGHADIWDTKADVFASAANYLAKSGWAPGQRWGRPVKLPEGFDANLTGRDTVKPISAWRKLGVEAETTGHDLMASVIAPDGVSGPAYFAYHNFNVIRRWNPSNYFALAVGILADQVVRE